MTFLLSIKKNSIVGIQYPLLSINNYFRFFIKAARIKNVKFFCIIHDLESLRTGGKDKLLIKKEIDNLSFYNCVIAHNNKMKVWLETNGLKNRIISLEVFDYLGQVSDLTKKSSISTINFAGNLTKSAFIYSLSEVKNWNFCLYGSNFQPLRNANQQNVQWVGEYGPEEILNRLHDGFGLIWDGENIHKCDEVLGNYLKYNNPHKFSLYIAAGLPVIAPRDSAIGAIIALFEIGILIDSLYDLSDLNITEIQYAQMKANINDLGKKVRDGNFFSTAIDEAEGILKNIE